MDVVPPAAVDPDAQLWKLEEFGTKVRGIFNDPGANFFALCSRTEAVLEECCPDPAPEMRGPFLAYLKRMGTSTLEREGPVWQWVLDPLLSLGDKRKWRTTWNSGKPILTGNRGPGWEHGTFADLIAKFTMLLPATAMPPAGEYQRLYEGRGIPAQIFHQIHRLEGQSYLARNTYVQGQKSLEDLILDGGKTQEDREAIWDRKAVTFHLPVTRVTDKILTHLFEQGMRGPLANTATRATQESDARTLLLENCAFLSELYCLSPAMRNLADAQRSKLAEECIRQHCTASLYHLLRDAKVSPAPALIRMAIEHRATGCLILLVIWATQGGSGNSDDNDFNEVGLEIAASPVIPTGLKSFYFTLLGGGIDRVLSPNGNTLWSAAVTPFLPPSLHHYQRLVRGLADLNQGNGLMERVGQMPLLPGPNSAILACYLRYMVLAAPSSREAGTEAQMRLLLAGILSLTDAYPEAREVMSYVPRGINGAQADYPFIHNLYSPTQKVGFIDIGNFPLRAICGRPHLPESGFIADLMLMTAFCPFIPDLGARTRAQYLDRLRGRDRDYADYVLHPRQRPRIANPQAAPAVAPPPPVAAPPVAAPVVAPVAPAPVPQQQANQGNQIGARNRGPPGGPIGGPAGRHSFRNVAAAQPQQQPQPQQPPAAAVAPPAAPAVPRHLPEIWRAIFHLWEHPECSTGDRASLVEEIDKIKKKFGVR